MFRLAKMHKVDLREAWPHEALDFTKWLAKEENLSLLSSTVGYDIRLIQEEAPVGDFSLDILAEEEGTGHKIIIENQLEKTNHDHLGKIITYASGHDAKVLIWIVKEAREEHRKAVDWLNEHTDEVTEFYLIRLELWKIGDNDEVAPKFELVSKPNDWSKAIREQQTGSKELSNRKIKNLEFWNQYKDFLMENNIGFIIRKPRPQHWADASVGSSLAHISFTIKTQEKKYGVEFYIPSSKALYEHLFAQKDSIEKDIGLPLTWMPLPEKLAARIKIEIDGDFYNETQWPKVFEWMAQIGATYRKVFPKYIDTFDREEEGLLL